MSCYCSMYFYKHCQLNHLYFTRKHTIVLTCYTVIVHSKLPFCRCGRLSFYIICLARPKKKKHHYQFSVANKYLVLKWEVDKTNMNVCLQFVAHPNVQQLLASIWYEGLPGFRRKNMVLQAFEIVRIGILFPVFSVGYILAPHSVIGQTMRKPFIKFICHSASYFFFLCKFYSTLLLFR